MTPYLPRTVAVGDKLRLIPYALDKQDNGSGNAPRALTGQVIYIHPRQLFATVNFPVTGYDGTGHKVDKDFAECWPIMPPERRLAHEDPEPAGWHKDERPTIRQRLQERDWSGMTTDQIAAALGTNSRTVGNAIYKLAKQGVVIPYKKSAGGRKARKTAAGSTSSDSGKEK